jgi:adenylate cyclase
MARLPTNNPAAYDAYLHATYLEGTAVNNRADADAEIRYAEQAIALDPEFADAYVLLALACQARMFGSGGGKEYDEKGFVAVEKALSLNPSLADAYVARGTLQFNRWHGYDIAAAIADTRRALELSPNSARAHHALGGELTHLGKHDEAITEFRTALRLDPKSPGPKFRMARALWQSNRFAEALETYERYAVGGFEKAVTLAYLGRPDDAWRAIATDLAEHRPEEPAEQRLGNSDISSARALLYAMAGKRAEAEQQIARSVALGQNDAHFHHAAFVIAAALAELGDEERAVHFLEVAANTGMPNYPLFRDNPSMVKLHGKKRYETFMANLNLRWQQIASQTR